MECRFFYGFFNQLCIKPSNRVRYAVHTCSAFEGTHSVPYSAPTLGPEEGARGAPYWATAFGVMAGVRIFRVNDVKENRQAADVAWAIRQSR